MDYESICCSLQTVRAARMFYEYGKLDRLLERDITTSSDDLYEVYYELLIAATDYTDQKYNESYEYDHWYFSFHSMMQYYRLIRDYGSLHSMKLSENPYVRKAEELQRFAVDCHPVGVHRRGKHRDLSSDIHRDMGKHLSSPPNRRARTPNSLDGLPK